MIRRAVPNIRSSRPAETRAFFVDLLGFQVTMDLGWITTVASPTDLGPGCDRRERRHGGARHRWRWPTSMRSTQTPWRGARRPPAPRRWRVRRFMVREPSGTIVNVLSHRSA